MSDFCSLSALSAVHKKNLVHRKNKIAISTQNSALIFYSHANCAIKKALDLLQKKYVLSLKVCSSLGQTLNY